MNDIGFEDEINLNALIGSKKNRAVSFNCKSLATVRSMLGTNLVINTTPRTLISTNQAKKAPA